MNIALAVITLAITVISSYYYIASIFRGNTRPHIFSWIIWMIVNSLACGIQIQHGAGWGAINLGFGGFIALIVVMISIRFGEKDITRSDLISFILSLLAIPLWIFAQQDLIAIMMAISIDALSFIPTIRKTLIKPNEENLLVYMGSCVSFLISIILIREKSLINILYPAVISIVNLAFIGSVIIARKRASSPSLK